MLCTPEHQQLQLFLLSIHHCHLYTHSTIFHRPGTRFKSRLRLPVLYSTNHLLWYKRTSHILLDLSVDDKTSDILSYLTKKLQGNFCKLITHFRNLSVFAKFIEPCLNTPEVDLNYILYSTMITGFSDHCTVEYV